MLKYMYSRSIYSIIQYLIDGHLQDLQGSVLSLIASSPRCFFPGTSTFAGRFPGHPGGSHIDSKTLPATWLPHPRKATWCHFFGLQEKENEGKHGLLTANINANVLQNQSICRNSMGYIWWIDIYIIIQHVRTVTLLSPKLQPRAERSPGSHKSKPRWKRTNAKLSSDAAAPEGMALKAWRKAWRKFSAENSWIVLHVVLQNGQNIAGRIGINHDCLRTVE